MFWRAFLAYVRILDFLDGVMRDIRRSWKQKQEHTVTTIKQYQTITWEFRENKLSDFLIAVAVALNGSRESLFS